MMRILRLGWVCALMTIPVVSLATVVSMNLVAHPVDVGPHADPDIVPLSAVPAWTNHGFGRHELISMSRSFPVAGRDVNLASAYGIDVVPDDSTLVPYAPVVLKVRETPLPPNPAYPRERALAATLWCLVLESGATEKTPLVVRVEADDPSLQKFAGSYVMKPGSLELSHGEIAGSRLQRDDRGVVSVVFDRVGEGNPAAGGRPVFVPLFAGGGGAGDLAFALVPHWAGPEQQDRLITLPWAAVPRGMNAFSAKIGQNANPLHESTFDAPGSAASGRPLFFHGMASGADVSPDERRMFATACHSVLLTADPSEDEPFVFRFSGHLTEAWDFLAGDGWKAIERPHGGRSWEKSFTRQHNRVAGYGLRPRLAGGWWIEEVDD